MGVSKPVLKFKINTKSGRIRPVVLAFAVLIAGFAFGKWWWQLGGIILIVLMVESFFRYRSLD